MRLNHREIDIRNRAIVGSDSLKTSVSFFIAPNFLASSTIGNGADEREIKVDAAVFEDELIEFRPTAVVMDVEGQEIDLLGYRLPETVSKLIVELHPMMLGDDGCAAVLRELMDQGFAVDLDDVRMTVFGFRNRQAQSGLTAEERTDQQTVHAIALEYLGACAKAGEGNFDLAIQTLEKVIARCPTNANFLCSCGEWYLRANNPKAAVATLTPAFRNGGPAERVFRLLATALLRVGDNTAALAAVKQAIALTPRIPENHRLAAQAALRLGMREEAVRHAHTAFELAPGVVDGAQETSIFTRPIDVTGAPVVAATQR